MKITVDLSATQSLKKFAERIKAVNPYANVHASAVAAGIFRDIEAYADKATVDRIAEGLVTRKAKRKYLLERLAALSAPEGDTELHGLAKCVRKLDRSNTESGENEAEK